MWSRTADKHARALWRPQRDVILCPQKIVPTAVRVCEAARMPRLLRWPAHCAPGEAAAAGVCACFARSALAVRSSSLSAKPGRLARFLSEVLSR